jgi:fumarylacetoacetate (FAA) hydrolase
MKLASHHDGSRDGRLSIVSRDLTRFVDAADLAPTLQAALDRWDVVEPLLRARAESLETQTTLGSPFRARDVMAPLPRAYEWVDGSAYLNHVILVRKARKAEPPATLRTDPLIYQGGGGDMLAPEDVIPLHDESWGCDFEGELCVVLGDVPMGTTAQEAARFVRLVGICNDVSLRALIPAELEKGFGFFQSKPATAFSPVFVTPDELGEAWQAGRVHLRLHVWCNGVLVGDCEAGPEMHFSFFDLVAHIAKTRRFVAGSILGSGTVSNADRARGISCLAERRMIETIEHGKPVTPFLKRGDKVEIELFHRDGRSVCGRISQVVGG